MPIHRRAARLHTAFSRVARGGDLGDTGRERDGGLLQAFKGATSGSGMNAEAGRLDAGSVVAPASAGRLAAIEVARGLAASAVVLYHCARHLNHDGTAATLMSVFQFGHAGVDLFFVISGFVICYVHFADIGRPGRYARYLRRRFERVFPIYWLATLATIGIGLAGHHGLPPAHQLAVSATLAPFGGTPVLGVAWTLQFEVLFYLAFGLCILHRRIGVAVAVLWLALMVLGQLRLAGGVLPGQLTSAYNIEFLFGVLGAVWMRRRPAQIPGWLLPLGAVLFAAVALGENMGLVDGYLESSRLLYGVPSAMIVLGAASISLTKGIRPGALLLALGSASYSIYLFQFIVIAVIWQIWLRLPFAGGLPDYVAFLVLAVPTLIGGVMISRLCEYPLLRFLRRRTATGTP